MADIMIRRAKDADFNAIFGLLEQLWAYKKLDREKIRRVFCRSLAGKNYRAFVAGQGKRVLGFAGTAIQNNLWQAGTMCHLNELIVDDTARGRGTGSKLLKAVEEYAVRKKCSGIDLESAMRRKRTHKFYTARKYDKKAYFFTKLFVPEK
jgi:GNAT superfamily N-acetyltransferase